MKSKLCFIVNTDNKAATKACAKISEYIDKGAVLIQLPKKEFEAYMSGDVSILNIPYEETEE